MGDRGERVQAVLDLPADDFEEAVVSLLEASGEKARQRFVAILAQDLLDAGGNVLKMMGDSGVGWANVLDFIRGYDAGIYPYSSIGFYARTLIDLRAAVKKHDGEPVAFPPVSGGG